MDATLFATAYALSTSIGLRPFLTLALASLALHFGYLHVAHPFFGFGSAGISLILGALAVLEFVADKVPVVDHGLHALHFAVKPVLAALLVDGTLPDMGPGDTGTYTFAALAALNAVGVHTGVAAARGASSVLTLGIANPVISLIEDVISAIAVLLALTLPFLGLTFALIITLAIILLARTIAHHARPSTAPKTSNA